MKLITKSYCLRLCIFKSSYPFINDGRLVLFVVLQTVSQLIWINGRPCSCPIHLESHLFCDWITHLCYHYQTNQEAPYADAKEEQLTSVQPFEEGWIHVGDGCDKRFMVHKLSHKVHTKIS